MVRKYVKKGCKLSEPIKKAIEDVESGMTKQSASTKHGISRQILCYHLKRKATQPEDRPRDDKRVSQFHWDYLWYTIYLEKKRKVYCK